MLNDFAANRKPILAVTLRVGPIQLWMSTDEKYLQTRPPQSRGPKHGTANHIHIDSNVIMFRRIPAAFPRRSRN